MLDKTAIKHSSKPIANRLGKNNNVVRHKTVNQDDNFSSSQYTILISLDKNYVELKGKEFPLLLGMDTSILIKLIQKPLIEYFTNAFKLIYDPMKNVKTD